MIDPEGSSPSLTLRAKWAILGALPPQVRRYYAHRRIFGVWPNLQKPTLFSEKLAWRYLYDRRSILADTCDKLASKEFALARASHLDLRAPLTFWSGPDPLAELPRGPLLSEGGWVFKPNHLSSGRAFFGIGEPHRYQDELLRFVRASKADEHRLRTTGWAYGLARPMYLFEERINLPEEDLPDYKLHVFGGKVGCIQVITDRWTDPQKTVYSPEWVVLSGPTEGAMERPKQLDLLIAIGEAIGAPFDYMRVDLYLHRGIVWFGELTPYPSFANIVEDRKLNEWLGGLWKLPLGEGLLTNR